MEKHVRNNQNSISVVIPVYNRKKYLRECLLSVIPQVLDFDEIIVVDDGSNEDITEEITDLLGKIRLVRQSNKGVAAARNLGVKQSGKRWIMFLDSDDIWHPNRIEEFSNDQQKYNFEVHISDVLFTGRDYSESLFQIKNTDDFSLNRTQEIDNPLEFVISGMSLIGVAVLKSSCEKINYFNEEMAIYEDTDFVSRLSLSESFVVNRSIVAEARRLEDDLNPLTSMETKNTVRAQEFWTFYLENLKKSAQKVDEITLINASLSGSLLNQALLTNNKKLLLKSAFTHPYVLKGIAKSTLAAFSPKFVREKLFRKKTISRG